MEEQEQGGHQNDVHASSIFNVPPLPARSHVEAEASVKVEEDKAERARDEARANVKVEEGKAV